MDDDEGPRRSPVAITASRAGHRRPSTVPRAYPLPEFDDDVDAVAALLAATRALLLAATPEQVAAVVATLVHDLGGALVPARFVPDDSALPLDVSLGLSEPVLPWAEPVSVAAMRLTRLVPAFVEDARAVLSRLDDTARLAWEADHEASTGLLTRRAWVRRLGTADSGDVVCLVRLADADDGVLRAAADLLSDALGARTTCGRYDTDVLACLVGSTSATGVAARLDRARDRFCLSGGVAVVGAAGPRAALDAASSALARARHATVLAPHDDVRGAW